MISTLHWQGNVVGLNDDQYTALWDEFVQEQDAVTNEYKDWRAIRTTRLFFVHGVTGKFTANRVFESIVDTIRLPRFLGEFALYTANRLICRSKQSVLDTRQSAGNAEYLPYGGGGAFTARGCTDLGINFCHTDDAWEIVLDTEQKHPVNIGVVAETWNLQRPDGSLHYVQYEHRDADVLLTKVF